MLFSSLNFIFIFLPFFCFIYFLLPWRLKNLGLLAGSLVFYGYAVKGHPFGMVLLLASVIINYLFGAALGRCETKEVQKKWLILALLYNFGWLFVFKYTGFAADNINAVLTLAGSGLALPDIAMTLPPGISFYTFSVTSYLMDIYHGRTKAEKSLLTFGTYVCMFPQLISGPVVTYPKIREQLNCRRQSLLKLDQGLRTFTIGLGVKVLLANRFAKLWNDIAAIGYESISTPLAWMGIIGFSLQIYFDFCGYSLMAKGLGEIMGFELPDNFRHPYTALSMTDFWRRWHITLGSWFREYVYIPLGGNQNGFLRQICNMLTVWLLTGLWHGASWNFVLWGVVLFLILVIEKAGLIKLLNRFPILGHTYMICLIPLTWTLFAITDFAQLKVYLMRLFPFFGQQAAVYAGDFWKYGRTYGLWIIIGLIFCTKVPKIIYRKWKNYLFMALLLLLIFWAAVYCLYIGMDDPFLYFSF